MYLHRIAADAMKGISRITVNALDAGQVESWAPLLHAQRSVLQIWNPQEEQRIWLPLSHTGGFDAALAAADSGSGEPALPIIDFAAYDSRFSRIQDRDLKLEMAISRLLYPVQLAEEARSRYEQLLKNRFRPAMLQLVGGQWNWYGRIPQRAGKLLSLKKMDRFLRKELLEKAASCHQPEFVNLIADHGEVREAGSENTVRFMKEELWQQAAQELCRLKPVMEAFCGLLSPECVSDERSCREQTIGTDGQYLYYTEQALQQVASRGRESLARLYTHMLVHCIYLHPFSGHTKNKTFRLACDLAAEYVVDRIFGPDREYFLEKQQVYDALLQKDPVLTADRILGRVMEQSPQMQEKLAEWFTRDSHFFWSGKDGEAAGGGPLQNGIPGENQKKWQAAASKWVAAGEGFLQAGEKKSGKRSPSAGHGQEKAELEKRQGHDYREFLRQFMVLKEDRILDLDSYDPVYYTYGLNTYGNIPLVEPLETKEVMRLEELVIAIDTSGSCSGRLVRFFLEETWSVFGQSENFFNQFHVRILQCDAMVQEDVKLTSLQEAEHYMKNMVIKGGGGTDFREAFSYIRRLQKQGELMHLKGILYFTDGFGTFPVQAPGCKTAFIFLKARFGQVEVPHWADKLLLELPEDADWEPEYTGGFQGNILR